ncbi:VOC family protein [Parapedobacter deserti]|uniref:VOC family protein n=1 Tax=Parapedobacter deserti TaxID=1912957 RepID=A0ABV7JMJ7_9SPHI
MKARISVLTLGVADLERSVSFYRDGMGLATEGIIGTEYENGAVAFFRLQDGLQLALWPWASIAADTGLPAGGGTPGAFTIGHNVNSKTEVDQVMDQAAKAGAAIVKPPQQTFYGGYAGYFRDIDGHLWEVVWNPALSVEEYEA